MISNVYLKRVLMSKYNEKKYIFLIPTEIYSHSVASSSGSSYA